MKGLLALVLVAGCAVHVSAQTSAPSCLSTLLTCSSDNPNCNTVTCSGDARAAVASDEPHGTALHLALIAFNSAQGADLATTMFAIGSRRGVEANPVFALVANTPIAAGAIKMAIAGASAWYLVRLHRTHPKAAWIAAIAGTGFYGALSVHNARVVR